jgi:redox-sensitive bicupin YhaK (pirin superfamily)
MDTVSYCIKGEFAHEDLKGNQGTLSEGGVQWMTAGKGIVHAEMPTSFEEDSVGFQLWLNLDRKNKYCEPKY